MVVTDEMTLRRDHTTFYRWSTKGHTPKVKSKRDPKTSTSFFGGLSLKSKKEFVHVAEHQNTAEFINFLDVIKAKYLAEIKQKLPEHIKYLKQLNLGINDPEATQYSGLILICLDGVGFHRSEELKIYLEQNHGIFELLRFPTYSPDVNPQEHVWKAVRADLSKVEGKYTFKETVDRACRFLSTTVFDYDFV